jgi:predicted glycoside hydrolase/deacetylase ChbG (UPF0249 family)
LVNAERYLIVNADDFGQSRGINEGIIEAHERGIVTSASLMVRWEAAPAAAAYAREHPGLSLGLHVDLGEWTYRGGEWIPLYEVTTLDVSATVNAEIERQFQEFRSLVGSDPTHIDSHQHVHRSEPVYSILMPLAQELEVPLRGHDPTISYIGAFYGQTGDGTPLPDAIGVTALIKILNALPTGVSELGCHPGRGDDVNSMYRGERMEELQVLCDPRIREVIAEKKIRLISFRGVRQLA